MSNKDKDLRTTYISSRAVAYNRNTTGISRQAVIPVQRITGDKEIEDETLTQTSGKHLTAPKAFNMPSGNNNDKIASPKIKPFQLLRTGAIPAKPVIQRISFKNSTGTQTVDVSEADIVEHLNKWIIGKMSNDELTTSPLFTDLNPRHLNWDEVYTNGGHERKVRNSFEAYNVLKEVKMSPGYTFALDHGIGGQQNQFASSTLKNTDRTEKGAIDGMLYPSGGLDEDVQGEGVAYKELSMSFSALAKKYGGDQVVAKAHLSLMKGEAPGGAYTDDEISKMRYHLEVLQLAEGRRSAGMFLFASIGLQNIADGKVTAPEAFGKVERQTIKTKGGDDKEKDVVTEEGNYPSAWVGSKKPLETVESHFKAGKTITDPPMHLKNNKKVLDKMKLHIIKFFATDDHKDFTKAAISSTPGAAFTNKKEALDAITNLICETYFPMIPVFYDNPGGDTAERKKNREAMTHLLGQHQIQHVVHGLTEDMLETEPKDEFKGLLPETKKEAIKLTAKDPEERAHNKRHIRLVRKLRDKKLEKFTDDGSGDELTNEVEAVVEERNKYKKAPESDKKKIELRKNLKRKLAEKVEGTEDIDTEDSAQKLLANMDEFLVKQQEVKKFKSDAFQKGKDLADAGAIDISGVTGYEGKEAIVLEGFTKRVEELSQDAYFAGLKGETDSPLKNHLHAKDSFNDGLAARNNIIAIAIKDKTDGTPKFYFDLTGLVSDFAARDINIIRNLTGLYHQTFAEYKV